MTFRTSPIYDVGSVWSDYKGEKNIIIGKDSITDTLVVYNYPQKVEKFITCNQVEDGATLKEKWENTVNFEKGFFEAKKEDMADALLGTFSKFGTISQGEPYAFYSIVGSESEERHLYYEVAKKNKIPVVNKATLKTWTDHTCEFISNEISKVLINGIIFRTYPECHYYYDELTGERYISFYTRLLFKYDGQIFPAEMFRSLTEEWRDKWTT